MAVILIILLIIIGLLAWILLAPIIIKIDSTQNIFEIRLVSMGRVRVILEQEVLKLKVHLFFFRRQFDYDLIEIALSDKNDEKSIKKTEVKKENESPGRWKDIKRIQKVLGSFKLQTFRLNIDTHNYYINAFLYPAFVLLYSPGVHLNVNFIGHNELTAIVKNRLFRLLIAYYSKS